MRIQSKTSIKQFGIHLRDRQNKGETFFKLLFEQRETIQSIMLLKPLINWAKFIITKNNAKLTIEEAKELTIGDIIERENALNRNN